MELGLLITAYQESRKPGKLERALTIADDRRVKEIVIVDDGSSDFSLLEERVHTWLDSHCREDLDVHVHRNEQNLGVFGNKLSAIRHAKSDWVQSLDSDNMLSTVYLDVLEKNERLPGRMFSPSFARPHFDYRAKAGHTLRLKNVPEFQSWKTFSCLLNTGNQFFHRPTMLEVTRDCVTLNNQLRQPDYFSRGDERADIKWRKVFDSADSFYFNKLWLQAGHEVYITPELEYDHEVHEDSSWKAAPPEKETLPLFYYLELQDRATARGFQHCTFKLLRFDRSGTRRAAVVEKKYPGGEKERLWVNPGDFTIFQTTKG